MECAGGAATEGQMKLRWILPRASPLNKHKRATVIEAPLSVSRHHSHWARRRGDQKN